MREFTTTRELAAYVGLPIDGTDPRGENFPAERDWGIFRGSGYGLAGTNGSGWLVTFAAAGQGALGSILGEGYLVAHAIEPNSRAKDSVDLIEDTFLFVDDSDAKSAFKFGGRCLLLGGPWDEDRQDQIWSQAKRQQWFETCAGGAQVNIELLDRWLISSGFGVR